MSDRRFACGEHAFLDGVFALLLVRVALARFLKERDMVQPEDVQARLDNAGEKRAPRHLH
jgi:hypothetical protein